MASLFMRFPGGRSKALTLSYDDGVEQDIKLLEIMDKYGLKGTFNLNSGLYPAEDNVYPKGTLHRRMPKSQVTKLYSREGVEVAVHGFTHPYLEQLPANRATYDIITDRINLEKQFGYVVRGMAYPFGTFSDELVDILKNCGICYARTVISSHNFDMPKDWLRLAATCHHADPMLMELASKFISPECGRRSPQMFYLWGHAYEFEDKDNWDVIENFAKLVSGHDEIWYATNIEIYEYEHAFKELVFNTEMTTVYNPTVTDLWFTYGDKPYMVKSGETIEIEVCR